MKIRILVVITLLSIQASAQKVGQALIDSVLTEIPKAANDSLKIRLYKKVADEYFFIDADQALKYSKTALALAVNIKWERAIGTFNSSVARAYGDKGNYDSCLLYNKRALIIQKKANDTYNICTTLNNMGAAEQNLNSNFTKALEYYLESLKIAEQNDDKYMMGNSYANISNIYLVQKNLKKALTYAFKGLEIRKKLVDFAAVKVEREQGRSMNNIGNIYIEMKDTLNARNYFKRAIPLLQKVEDKEAMANTYTYLAMTYPRSSPENMDYALKAEKFWNEVNPMHSDAINNLGSIGMIYLDKARRAGQTPGAALKREYLVKSESYIRKAILLSDQKGEIGTESYYKGVLAELQAINGDYKSAYLNFREFQKVQDSLFSQENKNNIAELEGKREIELRDNQIKINNLELEAQKRQRVALLIGMGLVVAIVGLLYWQNRTRKRTNVQLLHLNSELDEANKVKARFFAILSHDLRSPVANLINFLHLQKEAPGLMSKETSEKHEERITASAENLLENMESMLLWSKSQMQHFKPQSNLIPVSDLFDHIHRFFSGETRVSFRFENPEALAVLTDADYLKTIMQNLTNNAVRALKETSDAEIVWNALKENGKVSLIITDNGPGATTAQLNALYDEEAGMGTKSGLGLHLVRDLAKAIGCTITVKKNPDRGMTFRLSFV